MGRLTWQISFFYLNSAEKDRIERSNFVWTVVPDKFWYGGLKILDAKIKPLSTIRCKTGAGSIFEPKNYRPLRAS